MKIIGLLAGLLGGKTWLAWLVAGGSVLAILGGTYAWIDHGGYKRAELKWTVKYEQREREIAELRFKELERQAYANDQAKADERAALEQLEREFAALQELNQQLLEEAAADPDRDNIGLSASAVDRLNRIR